MPSVTINRERLFQSTRKHFIDAFSRKPGDQRPIDYRLISRGLARHFASNLKLLIPPEHASAFRSGFTDFFFTYFHKKYAIRGGEVPAKSWPHLFRIYLRTIDAYLKTRGKADSEVSLTEINETKRLMNEAISLFREGRHTQALEHPVVQRVGKNLDSFLENQMSMIRADRVGQLKVPRQVFVAINETMDRLRREQVSLDLAIKMNSAGEG